MCSVALWFTSGFLKGEYMVITFPDGGTREYPDGTTFMNVAKSISEGFARKVVAARTDGGLFDLGRPVPGDCAGLRLDQAVDQEPHDALSVNVTFPAKR